MKICFSSIQVLVDLHVGNFMFYFSKLKTVTVNGQLFIKEDIYFNYERNNLYTFSMRAKDNFHWSEIKVLTIEIIDINEPPVFTVDSYTLELDEETVSTNIN